MPLDGLQFTMVETAIWMEWWSFFERAADLHKSYLWQPEQGLNPFSVSELVPAVIPMKVHDDFQTFVVFCMWSLKQLSHRSVVVSCITKNYW